jgi:chromosome segregation ATPase
MEKVQIDSEVSGVESMMQFQQAILEELRSGIHVLQEQDNQIVGEAKALFAAVRSELEAQSKKIMDNGLQIFAQKVLIQAVQKSVGILSKRIDRVNKVLATITESLKGVPSKRDLRQHRATMDERLAQVEEINTALTTPME